MGQPAGVRASAAAAECIGRTRGTGGTETSQYPEEEKSSERPGVAASETGAAQTGRASARAGLWGAAGPQGPATRGSGQPKWLGSHAAAGESPVGVGRSGVCAPCTRVPRDTRNPAGSRGDHPPRLFYARPPIVHEYREGKVKSTPRGG